MRTLPFILALALAAPLAAFGQNPMQRTPPAGTASVGPSATSGSDAGPFPPLRDNGVVLNPAVAPPPAPILQIQAPMLSTEDAALLAALRRERVARDGREMDRAERESERDNRRLAQQPPPIIKPWPYQ